MSDKPRGIADLEDLDRVFGALAHQSRRTILSVLAARGGRMSSGEIAARFDCSWPTTTRHLRVLEEAGLVHVGLRGRERIYALDTSALHAVAGHWINRFNDLDAAGSPESPKVEGADMSATDPPRGSMEVRGKDRRLSKGVTS